MTVEPQDKSICPWCQTEIVWDPELGPEEECPHCFNELSDYRSVSIGIPAHDVEADEDDEDEEAADGPAAAEELLEDEEYRDPYGENVEQAIDRQEEAPECSGCRELMVLTGTRNLPAADFEPIVPYGLQKPVLNAPVRLNVYVCPSCFKVDTYLREEDRQAMVDAFENPN